ncbi:hypothetical protein OG972_48560 [Streptomyces sp. NBC_01669]|nr:hypothetical protein [Streptomyces sp. NBC_01669]MCX4538953.1 hypothetical protein [Streptomyces sp. NBC_01669]
MQAEPGGCGLEGAPGGEVGAEGGDGLDGFVLAQDVEGGEQVVDRAAGEWRARHGGQDAAEPCGVEGVNGDVLACGHVRRGPRFERGLPQAVDAAVRGADSEVQVCSGMFDGECGPHRGESLPDPVLRHFGATGRDQQEVIGQAGGVPPLVRGVPGLVDEQGERLGETPVLGQVRMGGSAAVRGAGRDTRRRSGPDSDDRVHLVHGKAQHPGPLGELAGLGALGEDQFGNDLGAGRSGRRLAFERVGALQGHRRGDGGEHEADRVVLRSRHTASAATRDPHRLTLVRLVGQGERAAQCLAHPGQQLGG